MQPIDLNSISVKSPCTVPWETMTGDERTRFCAQCKLNVFNLSGMTRAEAEEVIRNKEGRLCVRYVKRADGTLLTRDCAPIRAARSRRKFALVSASFLLLLFNVCLWLQSRERRNGSDRMVMLHQAKASRLYKNHKPARTTIDWIETALRYADPPIDPPPGRDPFVVLTMGSIYVDTTGF